MAANARNRFYIERDGQPRRELNPAEEGFKVIVNDKETPFSLQNAQKNDATIVNSDYSEYYMVSRTNGRHILRKSIHSNNSNSNSDYTNVEELKTEENLKRHLDPKPTKTFGTLPAFLRGGRRRHTRRVRRHRRKYTRRR